MASPACPQESRIPPVLRPARALRKVHTILTSSTSKRPVNPPHTLMGRRLQGTWPRPHGPSSASTRQPINDGEAGGKKHGDGVKQTACGSKRGHVSVTDSRKKWKPDAAAAAPGERGPASTTGCSCSCRPWAGGCTAPWGQVAQCRLCQLMPRSPTGRAHSQLRCETGVRV